MHYLFIFLALSGPIFSADSNDIKAAKASIIALISPLIPGSREQKKMAVDGFRVDSCGDQKINWTSVLLMKKGPPIKYSFKNGCDLEGSVSPKLLEPFPILFALRHLKQYDQVKAQGKITADIDLKPILLLEIRSGDLKSPKDSIKFEVDYRVRLDPMSAQGTVDKNLGGEIRITEYHGKKVNLKEKIMIH